MSISKWLLSIWYVFTGRSGPVAPTEPLARYLVHSDWFNKGGGYVKRAAFMPRLNPKTSALEASVYRILSLSEAKIWQIGLAKVANPAGKRLYGRAELAAQTVKDLDLKIDPDDIPRHHANIVGWPDEKPKQQSLAQHLAKAAALRLRPSS